MCAVTHTCMYDACRQKAGNEESGDLASSFGSGYYLAEMTLKEGRHALVFS